MIAREGDGKLTDFGIAKAFDLMYNEEGHTVVGKDAHLSPEQANWEVTDARADSSPAGSFWPNSCSNTIFSRMRRTTHAKHGRTSELEPGFPPD